MDLQTFRRWLYWISSALVVITAVVRLAGVLHPAPPPPAPPAITRQEAVDQICGPDKCAWIRQVQQLGREDETEPSEPSDSK